MRRVKLLRILLILILVVFVGVVITSYRSGKNISDSTADEDLRQLVDGEQLIQKQFNQKNYQKEQLESEITAREMVNYQDGINVLEDIHFTRGQGGMDVRSDFGRHDPESGDVFLWDNVIIEDGQGLTIRTDSALHQQESAMVLSDKLVEFSDRRLSGRSLGLIYNIGASELQLPADVSLTIHGNEGSVEEPALVRAGFLKMIRKAGIAYLAKGVHLEQGRLSLDSQTLRIEFDEENRRILHVSAFGDVMLTMADSGDDGEPVSEGQGLDSLSSDPGRKTLHARQLEIFFDQGGPGTTRLEYLVARGTKSEKAIIRLYPAPGADATGNEVRQLEGHRLIFRFRHDGPVNRLDSFHAVGGCRMRMADGGPDEIQLEGEILTARFDPLAQELDAAEVSGAVLFSRGQERIRGEQATYDAASGLLHISGEENGRLPRLWNDTAEIEAVNITYAVDGQLLVAKEDVWVKVQGEDGGEMGLDVALFSEGSGGEPVFIHADLLESDLEAGVSNFSGTVRVLNGENVLSARTLWLYHEQRRMEALDRVQLVIHPPAAEEKIETVKEAAEGLPGVQQLADSVVGSEISPPDDDQEPLDEAGPDAFDRSAPLQITCRELVYDDLARYIILNDKVTVRKHRTRMAADHMEVQLGQENNRILHIIASADGAPIPGPGNPDLNNPDLLVTGFNRQEDRLRGPETQEVADIADGAGGSGTSMAPGGAGGVNTGGDGQGRAAASRRPQVPQVTLSQPGGRTASGERVLYYPEERVAVLVGIDTVATIVDPRSGSAQGTSLTYHLADGKILNRANDNEVTLILLHAGASSTDVDGVGGGAPTGGTRSGGASSTRAAGRSPAGRSSSR